MWILFLSLAFARGSDCNFAFDSWLNPADVRTFISCLNSGPIGSCPTAEAGSHQIVALNETVLLDSTGSLGVNADLPSFFWQQVDNGAPAVSLADPNGEIATFIPTEIGNYLFELTVTSACRSVTDQVLITVEDNVVFPDAVQLSLMFNAGTTVVEVTNAGDDRLFVVGKNGVVRIFSNGQLLTTPFLDISNVVVNSGEQGLLGLTFDPDYATNGFFYVNYVGTDLNGGGGTRVTRIAAFEVSADPNIADLASGNVLLSVDQPASNHNGGQLAFGPDGMLYVTLGDGGGANDTFGHGQNTNSLLATILRLEVDGPDTPYRIPSDNPFAGSQPGFLPEIWAYGLRNPWRMSFDSLTGDLYIADVGQNQWEEINVQSTESMGGENYGWPLKEGTSCFDPPSNCDPGGLTDPVFEYNHSLGCSVTGGYVYRGNSLSALEGFYIMADYCDANFWLLKRDNASAWQSELVPFRFQGAAFNGNVTGFGQDQQGEIYICTQSGDVYQISATIP